MGATSSPVSRLILLPGMDGTGDLFASFASALPEGTRPVALRYPPDRCLSYSELLEFVQSSCKTSEPFAILAESFSSPIAISFAATRPSNLVGLVLCVAFANSPLKGWKCSFASVLVPVLLRAGLPDFAARRWLVGPDAPAELLAAVRTAIRSLRPQVLASRMREVLTADSRAELAKIEVPILYIRAKRDRLVSASSLEEIRRAKPDVCVIEIDGPHLLLQREPALTAAAVVRFLQNLPAIPPACTWQTTPPRDPSRRGDEPG
jgi:pimeloyl-[acyl-carrier protein] methyl ester esterase